MCDEVDLTNDRVQLATDAAIDAQRRRAAQIPAGEPGECDYCGQLKPRLVGGACGRCRDERRLP